MRVRKINGEALYFILCVVGIVLLAWILKNYIRAGDEVIAGISASLITLLGVKLTNKNSQIALDKQLKHQSETFQAQMKDQAEGFKDQMNHQSELLERQMKHQSDENEKERKQKFKHDQYLKLVKDLGEIQSFFSNKLFFSDDSTMVALEKLAFLNQIISVAKTVATVNIYNACNELYDKYCDLAKLYSKEYLVLRELKAKDKSLREQILFLQKMNISVSDKFFSKEKYDGNGDDLQIILKQKLEADQKIKELNVEIANETQRLVAILKNDIENVKRETQFIIMLINIELEYNTVDDFMTKTHE
ncbi:hypothetical protein [Acinetobacter tandoii]